MKTTSRFALVAAAGLLLGAAMTPAKAADLGGGCCADLEERVAELEATTARKGNRVVSLQVYGQVNKALLIYDDGVDSDALVVDNYESGSRLGFTGKATIKPGLTAGYVMEWDMSDASSAKVNQNKAKDGDDVDGVFALRYNNVYIESERLGRITIGQGSTAADGAYEVVLGNSLKSSNVLVGNALSLSNGDKLSGWANNLDAPRDDVIRYDTPSVYGFILSASWGDNDYSDVALRFKKEFNSLRVAAALAYQWDSSRDGTGANEDEKFETLGGSISVMHVPTGLYAAFAAGNRDLNDYDDEQSFWYIQGGIEKKFLPYGTTTIYGEYGQYTSDDSVYEDEATRLGFGVVQKIDAAAMDVYAQATFWSFDLDGTAADPEDLTTVMVGSRIKF